MGLTSFRELMQWQSHLEKVFESLNTNRNRQKGKPFFILEHGLDDIDLAELNQLVIQHGSLDLSFDEIELPFIVFATEIGFQYEDARHDRAEDTSDYWPMFDLRIPSWRKKPKNYKFFKYAFSEYLTKKYPNVYMPDGAWFESFPYISWPVYQAILCKDARQDLIRLMKKLNQEEDLGSITSPLELGEKLGRAITRRVEQNESIRLDQFQDQEKLLGEIAYSIVKPENDLQVDFLSTYALERLKKSLPKELLDVVDYIRANISRTVSKRQSTRANSANERHNYQASSSNRLSGEMSVYAQYQTEKWQFYVNIPKLRSFESSISQLREVLHKPLNIGDQPNGRIPPKTLLYRGITLPVDAWPEKPLEKIFDSEQFPSAVSNAVRGDWKMFASEDLLLKCENNLARLQRHFEVIPNQQYLYVCKHPLQAIQSDMFRRVETSLGSSIYAYQFQIDETRIEEAQFFIQAANLVLKRAVEIVPVGQLPYIYEKDLTCKYSINQIADFKITSAAMSLLVTVAEEGFDEYESITLRRGELLRIVPDSPGSYWIRLETVLGDEGIGSLWRTETIAAMRVDFLTPDELAAMGNLNILMLSSVAQPSFEQILNSEVEVSFSGPEGLQVNILLQALDVEGMTLSSLREDLTEIPINAESVKMALLNLKSNLDSGKWDEVASITCAIETNGVSIFSREFFSSRKNLRWQRLQNSNNRIKLIAKVIDASSFKVFGTNFTTPTSLRILDSEACIREGVEVQDILMLVPLKMADQWPPSINDVVPAKSNSNPRLLEDALISLLNPISDDYAHNVSFAFSILEKQDLGNILLLLQLLWNEMKQLSPEVNDFINGPFLEHLSAQLSIDLIGPRWIEVEQTLAAIRRSRDSQALTDLVNSIPDLLDELKKEYPAKFGWINTRGLWTGKEQVKVSQLSSAQRAIVLANKCFAPDKNLPPRPEAFAHFSEKHFRAFDLGLMFTINPLVAGERMMHRPISSSGWEAFWENRQAISAYCRINHLLNLELGVEWTWN